MSFPVTLAAGMIFLPTEAALIAFIGSFDPRELKGSVSLAKSIFNRSQVAASVMAGSALFHVMDGAITRLARVLLPGAAALLLTPEAISSLWLSPSRSRTDRRPGRLEEDVRCIASRITWLATCFLASLPCHLLLRLRWVGSGRCCCSSRRLCSLGRCSVRPSRSCTPPSASAKRMSALRGAAGEMARERKDERLALAGELHDEVLPSLFKVHLMGQVLKQDLAAGRLLELDDDLPELLLATDAAQRAIRDLLGDLRRSPLGAAGLVPTVRMLVDQLAAAGAPPVDHRGRRV